jgi:hypothetical protein
MATLAAIFDRFTLARSAAQVPARVCDASDDYRVRPLANENLYYFTKKIDNSGVVREDDPRAGRACWRVIGMGVVSTTVLLCMMLPSVLGLLSGYQLQSLRDEKQRLETAISATKLDESRLLSPEQLDKVAKARDYAAPAAGHMVYLDNRDGNRLARNRDRSVAVAAR